MISKNRRWRIELCADVCGGDLGAAKAERTLLSAEIGVRKISTYNISSIKRSIELIFAALESA